MGILDDAIKEINQRHSQQQKSDQQRPGNAPEGADGRPTKKRMFDYSDEFRNHDEYGKDPTLRDG